MHLLQCPIAHSRRRREKCSGGVAGKPQQPPLPPSWTSHARWSCGGRSGWQLLPSFSMDSRLLLQLGHNMKYVNVCLHSRRKQVFTWKEYVYKCQGGTLHARTCDYTTGCKCCLNWRFWGISSLIPRSSHLVLFRFLWHSGNHRPLAVNIWFSTLCRT